MKNTQIAQAALVMASLALALLLYYEFRNSRGMDQYAIVVSGVSGPEVDSATGDYLAEYPLSGDIKVTGDGPSEGQRTAVDLQDPPLSLPETRSLDTGHLSLEEKLGYLMNSRENYNKHVGFGGEAMLAVERSFIARCTITVLREKGRADYGDPQEIAKLGGFSLSPRDENEHVVAADRARYAFGRGEFPAYDLAQERLVNGMANPSTIRELSDEERSIYESAFEEALRSLGVGELDQNED